MTHTGDIETNRAGNRGFNEVLAANHSRRGVLRGGMLGAAAFFAGTGAVAASARPAAARVVAAQKSVLGFDAIATSIIDDVVVPPGYIAQAICKWGDPLNPDGPKFNKLAKNPARHQRNQFGMGHDGLHYFPLGPARDSSRRGLLAINHEYTVGDLLFVDGRANWTAEKTAKEQAAHGVSIAKVVRNDDGSWESSYASRARRYDPNSQLRFDGPAAGNDLLKTAIDPTGTRPTGLLNQCGNGSTPWGTYLTTEENFNGYFWEQTNGTAPAITPAQRLLNDRYGIRGQGFGYQWATTDEQWRADLHPNRPNTFGWIVEIDPYKERLAPIKHTALGRFKHEGAAFATSARGQAVVYMGDDERFDYIYKFVSTRPWVVDLGAGRSPLAEGTLYVAKFNDDGTGQWLPLVHGQPGLNKANGFADQGEVLIKARLAADALGATPMDRPEWTTVNEETGDVFVTCTNNSRRGADDTDAANPRGPNNFGHILKWNEGGDPASTTFDWNIFLLAGDEASGSTLDPDDLFGSPDGLWYDPITKILWIQTDGGQPDGTNNQMLACDPVSGEIRRFLVGPPGCEVTGVTATPDRKTLFIDIQHPGDAGTPDNPRIQSNWPDYDPEGRPRPATVAIRRADGGVVGLT